MSVLVVGISHRSAPVSLLERGHRRRSATPPDVARRAARGRPRRRGRRARDLQPGRGLRRHRGLPRRRRRGQRPAVAAVRRPARGAVKPPLRALGGPGRPAPVPGRLRARLDGRRRVADPRPAAPGVRRRARRRRRPDAARAVPEGAARSASGPTAETGIDEAGQSLVTVGLERAVAARRPARPAARVLVVGAGSMGALAGATLRRAGAGAGRRRQPHRRPTPPRLADDARRPRHRARRARARPSPTADVVVSSHRRDRRRRRRTTLVERAVDAARRPAARDPRPGAARATSTRACATLPGVTLVDLESLQEVLADDRGRRRRRGRPRRSSPRRSATSWPGSAPPRSRRPSSRCAAAPTRSSTPSSAGSPAGCPTSTPRARAEVAGDRAPGRRQAAPHPDRAGEGARRGARGAVVRRRAARAVRPRPGRARRRRRPSDGAPSLDAVEAAVDGRA